MISLAWLAAGCGFVAFFVGVITVQCRNSNNRRSNNINNTMMPVPQYDIELRDTSNNNNVFRDRPAANSFSESSSNGNRID